jgi:hypothetical protein
MNNDAMVTRDRARKTLNEQLLRIEGSSMDSVAKALAKSEAVGVNMVAEETGRFGPWDENNYRLEDGPPVPLQEVVRDRLLVHTRQDVASIYALALDAYRQAYLARRNAVLSQFLMAILIVLNIVALTILWFVE